MDKQLQLKIKEFTNDEENRVTSSMKITRALQRNGIRTITDLRMASIDDLRRIRGFGQKIIDILINVKTSLENMN